MLKIIKPRVIYIVFAIACIAAPLLPAQQPFQTIPAPVPAPILSAKKVFISNAGMDSGSLAAFKAVGDPDEPYNQFYAAMKTWGRYELVAAPADADLVLEIRFAMQISSCGDVAGITPQFGLTILDARTRFILWRLVDPVQGAFRKATWIKNVNQGMANLMDDLKKLVAPRVPPTDGGQQ